MAETQLRGVQVIARISGNRAHLRSGNTAPDVQRVARQGMPGRGQVDPYLVGPPRLDAGVAEKPIRSAFQD